MARSRTYIELDGPLFEDDVLRRFKGAVFSGIEELADEADDIMASHIAAGGMVDTGRLLASVNIQSVRSSQDVIGYSVVTPTDTWQGSVTVRQTGSYIKTVKVGQSQRSVKRRVKTWSVSSTTTTSRPPRIWLTKGTRRGAKLRSGYDFYARTATAVRAMNHHAIVAKYIAEALN